MPIELYYLLVGGIHYRQDPVVKCGMPAMADSVTKAQSHDEGNKSLGVTGLQNKSIPGDIEERVGIEV